MSSNKPSRKHHYVPCHLLQNFTASDGSLTVYDLQERKRWQGIPKSEGFEKDLYAFLNQGEWNYDSIEKELNLAFDAPGSIAIAALLCKEQILTPMVHDFIGFMGAQLVRTPAYFEKMEVITDHIHQESFRRMASYDKEFRRSVTADLKESGASEDDIAELLRLAASSEIRVATNRQFTLLSALSSIQTVCDQLIKMKWAILDVPEGEPDLVITDNPFAMVDMSEAQDQPLGLSNKLIDIFFPLSSRVVAHGSWEEGDFCYGELLPGVVNEVNRCLFMRAKRFIYSAMNLGTIEAEAFRLHGTGPQVRIERIKLPTGGLMLQSIYK